MTQNALLITLGHNSSAVFYDGVNKPIGYEEERLTRKKSDSSFPLNSIKSIIEAGCNLRNGVILISHWFNTHDLSQIPEKYFNLEFIENLCSDFNMTVEHTGSSESCTHHDAHMFSSLAFLEGYEHDRNNSENTYFIVADGFGNYSEVLSIYVRNAGSDSVTLIDRMFGYENSLGLLYQYATSYVGMKENQDEYKFLGYESRITEVVSPDQIAFIASKAETISLRFFRAFSEGTTKPDKKDVIDFEGLHHAKNVFYNIFEALIHDLNMHESSNDYEDRVVIGFFIQQIVENFFIKIVKLFGMKNVVLSGGCFYNVKLNNKILSSISGNLCIVPVAGDQGAAIGMYRKRFGSFRFHDMCFGNRNLRDEQEDAQNAPGIIRVKTKTDLIRVATELLEKNHIVNVVHGSMEFGPRALCNTSTLALPTQRNVNYINALNDRNTIMPMAPVVLKSYAHLFFESSTKVNRVIGSNKFMAVTHKVGEDFANSNTYAGVTHNYPIRMSFSARPQIVTDQMTIGKILMKTKTACLINTSFNSHGQPIVFSVRDAIENFYAQKKNDYENRVHLIICDE